MSVFNDPQSVFKAISFIVLLGFITAAVGDEPVYIRKGMPYVEVSHNGKKVRIERVQDNGNMIDLDFALTSRPCPPYCIQPMQLAPGVETIGELEMLEYLQQVSSGDKRVMVIDSREARWLQSGMIPGAVSIPWTKLYNKTANTKELVEILQLQFGAVKTGPIWNFQGAKTLVFYCNGAWCGQSPTNIRALLALGYPAEKLKWYRGGMQDWKSFGLTTIPYQP